MALPHNDMRSKCIIAGLVSTPVYSLEVLLYMPCMAP